MGCLDREKPALGPLPSRSCGTLAASADLGTGRATCGWKGVVVAERQEGWCRELSHSWKCRCSHLRSSLSSPLHLARISLALVRLMHLTLHLAVKPIQVGISVTALPASMATFWMRPALGLPFRP